jgi:hypothetical protein
MSTGESPGSGRRSRRSTRMGIALLVALALIVIAVVWGIQRWNDEEMDGPAVWTAPDIATMTPALVNAA